MKGSRYIIMGAGALGSFIGGCLSRNKEISICLVGRKPHINSIKERGLEITFKTGEIETFKVEAVTNLLDIVEKPDLIILAVKTYQNKQALESIVDKFGTGVPILTFQNGNPLPEISSFVGEENTIGGTTLLSVEMIEPGKIKQTFDAPFIIGELRMDTTGQVETIKNNFINSGLDCIISENVIGEIWAKLIINSTNNTLSAALNQSIRELYASLTSRKYCYAVLKESFGVANLDKIDLDNISSKVALQMKDAVKSDDDFKKFADFKGNTLPDIKLSMASQLQKGIKTEIDYINGYIAQRAKAHNYDAKFHNALVEVIHDIESQKIKPNPENLNRFE